MNEMYYENLLNIETSGKYPWTSKIYHPYEATTYEALNLLLQSYKVNPNSHIVDFGSGKGRFSFYMNKFLNVSVTGVEMDENLYKKSIENKQRYFKMVEPLNTDINFRLGMAENFEIKDYYNIFYFFNPFSLEIFKKVVFNIIDAIKFSNREIDIILHYPIKECVEFMESLNVFSTYKEIRLPNFEEIIDENHFLYKRRRFLIYTINK